MEQYAWFIWSLGFLAVWFGLYLARPAMRKQMLRISIWTAPLGLKGAWGTSLYLVDLALGAWRRPKPCIPS